MGRRRGLLEEAVEVGIRPSTRDVLTPEAFSIVFQKAVERAAPNESLRERVTNLIDSITFSVYQYTTRGLFECDKLTYLAQLTFQVLRDFGLSTSLPTACLDYLSLDRGLRQEVCKLGAQTISKALSSSKSQIFHRTSVLTLFAPIRACLSSWILLMNREVNAAELDFLLRSPVQTVTMSPVEFLSHQAWGAVKVSIDPLENSQALRVYADTGPHEVSGALFWFKHGAVLNMGASISLHAHRKLIFPGPAEKKQVLAGV
ncbi:hypothetical protein P7K49_010861 [Saguinus oedipus]|uniref:Uncharacterized protein n=1 Tax=Saguinus oedipus TaxID=9490 RepID=A0ABQ9VPM0_SAGOE|nr:hypothetical protein P7K49_010861 [Saguinus oedipus]